ncbi:MAG TPA: TIGR00730 family Rossman fold protein [Oceanospirillales bacterium]|nr:TIGR00730 family Rossman fold protein [Oceanospirillales bacterium]
MKTIAVYCSSSDVIHQDYFSSAHQLGKAMAENDYQLVYGGGMVGLMGEVARSVKASSGKTIGVVPKALNLNNVVNDIDDELIITDGMRERKAIMDERGDAFIGLPGGFGTFEEMFEVLTLKQLGYHNKAIVFLNIRGYYDKLFEMFEHIYAEKFAKKQYRVLYHISETVEDAMAYLKSYQPPDLPAKWFI